MRRASWRAGDLLSEPEVGSDVQGISLTAKKAVTGSWELNGQKKCGSRTGCGPAWCLV